jgi:hypothetical protein
MWRLRFASLALPSSLLCLCVCLFEREGDRQKREREMGRGERACVFMYIRVSDVSL